jgi:glycosyltransferase involved in cell wall biosynthesis
LTRAKDPENLLEAVRQLPPDVGLMWVGDGRLRSRVRQKADRFGIGDRVRWLGYRPDVRPWMDKADIIVSSSRSEALPMSLLEAMSMGKPVVATRVGGVPEVVTDGYDGMTVPARDPAALAAAIRSLAEDPQRRGILGQRARRRIQTTFSLEHMADRYESLYYRVCNRDGAAPREAR